MGELDQIAEIRGKDVEPLLKECHFQIACDVKNPLCGENGAVYIFGPQKGVKEEEKEILDQKMVAQTTAGFTGADLENLMNESAIIAAKQECSS